MSKDFSIIIPCYNEGDRLKPFLVDLIHQMKDFKFFGEIILVDDGSAKKDKEIYAQVIEDINSPNIKLIHLNSNQGKGSAVRHGFELAEGRWIGFVDADGATNAKEVFRLLFLALQSSHLSGVFASRILMFGYHVHRSTLRHLTGRIFVTLVDKILHIPVYDSQCGCKFFKRNDIMFFLPVCQEKGFLFDLEIIAFGYYRGLKFLEVPVDWTDIKGSKVNVVIDSIKMFLGLWRIKKRIKIKTR
ncbi:MAG TPA: glycosyltransferase [Candidatus Omnitrophota bacterium]|nr:glycosyltransferase [Candidatus Omnitrophota bacterium]